MEVKKKSFTGLFLKYIVIFCVNTLVLLILIFFIFEGLIGAGLILPANYAEAKIEEKREMIAASDTVSEQMLPYGSRFGVFTSEGDYLYGTMAPGREQENAWEAYESRSRTVQGEGYFKFIPKDNGEICIVKYRIASRFSEELAELHLPDPVLCFAILYIVLFAAQAFFISRYFSKYLTKKLKVLRDTTENIQGQNLEFERSHSEIAEIEEILDSLCSMRDALRKSLENQWEERRRMTEQISALAHDIKTPLTVIKGNAELLAEEDIGEAAKEYPVYIWDHAKVIEDYLTQLSELLLSEKEASRTEIIKCSDLAQRLAEQTEILASSQCRESSIIIGSLDGKLRCDVSQMLRAWSNIVMNGLSYTPEGKSIGVQIGIYRDKGEKYLYAKALDMGPGFTEEALRHAAEKFYQGDKSRHSREHKGIGLYIASEFAKEQGGKVVVENADEEGYGGQVTLYIRLKDEEAAGKLKTAIDGAEDFSYNAD